MGGNRAPYRACCGYIGNSPEVTWLGGAYQHNHQTPVEVYLPGVKVHGDPSGPTNVAPYEVFNQLYAGSCGSAPTFPAIPVGGWLGNGSLGDYQYTLVPGQLVTVPGMAWTDQGTKQNLGVCRTTGYVNAAAKRYWHGARAFNSHDPSGCTDVYCPPGSPGYAEGGSYESYQSGPDETKYLNMFATCTLTQNAHVVVNWVGYQLDGRYYGTIGTDDLFSGSQTASVATSVDPYSGVISQGQNTLNGSLTLTHIGINTIDGGSGPTTSPDNGSVFPGLAPAYCVASWTANCGGVAFGGAPAYPGSGPGQGYSGNATTLAAAIAAVTGFVGYGGATWVLSTYIVSATEFKVVINVTPPGNVVVTGTGPEPEHGTGNYNYTLSTVFSGSSTWTLDVALGGQHTASDVLLDLQNLLQTIPLNDQTRYPFRTDGMLQVAPLASRNERQTEVSPIAFPPATVDNMTLPIADVNMNSPWTSATLPPPLGWTDGTHNNDSSGIAYGHPGYGGPESWIPTYTQMPWFDPFGYAWKYPIGRNANSSAASGLVTILDGQQLGALNPAGYNNAFCWQFQDWRGCTYNTDIGSDFAWNYYGWGSTVQQYNMFTGAQLPLACTQWTNNFQCIDKPPGAYVKFRVNTPVSDCSYGDLTGLPYALDEGAVWMGKWAEVKLLLPSVNYARPAGADKFLYDETQVYDANNVTSPAPGGIVTLNDLQGNPVTITHDAGQIWGGPCVGGFYDIASVGTGTVQLGALKYSVPSDWASRSGDSSICFGLLRWVADGAAAPSLLGAVAATYAAGTVTFAANQTAFGMRADTGNVGKETVDLLDANFAAIPGGTSVAAVRTADNTFTVAAAAAFAATAYVRIAAARPYYVNDNWSKGNYLAITTLLDNRTNGEANRLSTVADCAGSTPPGGGSYPTNNGYSAFTQTQACLKFVPCCPGVICFSPNGETWANGTTYPVPVNIPLDERYGTYWQGYVQQSMTDPFWQVPHEPVDSSFAWNGMDDGTCKAKYYPHSPLVEPETQSPWPYALNEYAAPGTPQVVIGWLSPVANAPGANVYEPPGFIGFNCDGTPASATTLWGAVANMCANPTCNLLPGGYASYNLPC